MTVHRVLAVTGSRADWGLLRPVLEAIRASRHASLLVAATGGHLSDSHGATVKEIEAEGFAIDARVPILDKGRHDTPPAIACALGRGVIGFAQAIEDLRPDLLLVLGDRYEILAAVQAALLLRVPVAHIAGGDITVGAVDDSIRHAITKMAHLHFPTNSQSARRLRQLGEAPERIHLVGSPGIDALKQVTILPREALFDALDLPSGARNLLITFHPATLDPQPPMEQLEELLAALSSLSSDMALLMTGSNADVGGLTLSSRLKAFAQDRPNSRFAVSLGHRLYASVLAHFDLQVGNSSSGLMEAPSFSLPSVNIGDRQKGRPRASSVIDCPPERSAIIEAIGRALSMECGKVVNPYGEGDAAARILTVLEAIDDPKRLLQKEFLDQPSP